MYPLEWVEFREEFQAVLVADFGGQSLDNFLSSVLNRQSDDAVEILVNQCRREGNVAGVRVHTANFAPVTLLFEIEVHFDSRLGRETQNEIFLKRV